jgi:hypothetical protein
LERRKMESGMEKASRGTSIGERRCREFNVGTQDMPRVYDAYRLYPGRICVSGHERGEAVKGHVPYATRGALQLYASYSIRKAEQQPCRGSHAACPLLPISNKIPQNWLGQ